MKKEIIIISLLMLIILSFNAAAEYKEIHNEWHSYEDSYEVEGVIYSHSMNLNYQNKLIFKTETNQYLIDLYKCETVDTLKFCYENTSNNRTETTIASNGLLANATQIVILKDTIDEKDVKITFEYNVSNDITKNSEFKINIKSNVGDWIRNANFEFEVPEGIIIAKSGSFVKVGEKMRASARIAPYGDTDLRFEFRPEIFDIHKINYTLTYDALSSIKTIEKTMNLDVSRPYSYEVELNPTKLSLPGTAELNVKITNHDKKNTLYIKSFILSVPPKFNYNPVKNLKLHKVGQYASRVTKINAQNSDSFKLIIDPTQTGKWNFSAMLDLEIDDDNFKDQFEKILTTDIEGLDISYLLSKKEVTTGSNLNLAYTIVNNDPSLTFYDIEIVLTGDLYNDTILIPEISPGQRIEALSYDFKAPVIEYDKTYTFLSNTTFQTPFNQILSDVQEDKLKVIGAGELLSLSKTINQTKAELGEELLIEVNVQNIGDDNLNIQVFDEYPRQLELMSGETFKTLNLINKEKTKAYIYKIKIPMGFTQEKFNITTRAIIPSLGYSKEEYKTITVNIPEPFVNSNQTGTTNPDTEPVVEVNSAGTTRADDAEPGFFEGIIIAIEDFFTGLFGG